MITTAVSPENSVIDYPYMSLTAQLRGSVDQRPARFDTHLRQHAEVIHSPQLAGLPRSSDKCLGFLHAALLGVHSVNAALSPHSTCKSYAASNSMKQSLPEISRWIIVYSMYLFKGSILESSLLYLNGMRRPVPKPRIKQRRDGKSTAVSHPQQIYLVEMVTPEALFQTSRSQRMEQRAKQTMKPDSITMKDYRRKKSSATKQLVYELLPQGIDTAPHVAPNSNMDPLCEQPAFPIKLQLQLRNAHTA
jgi:hypothetical protein